VRKRNYRELFAFLLSSVGQSRTKQGILHEHAHSLRLVPEFQGYPNLSAMKKELPP